MNLQIIQLVCLLVITLIGCVLIWTTNSNNPKNKVFNNLPKMRKSWIDKMSENKDVKHFLDELVKGNGFEDDSVEKVFKQMAKNTIMACLLIVAFGFVGYTIIGVILGLLFIFYPIISRLTEKTAYKKKYMSGFYLFLNYIILYVSGGVPMEKALIEVEKLIPEKEVIKKRLKNVVAKNNISGLSGNTYIDALYELNRDLDYPEINLFIHTAERSIERGDEISTTLASQLDDIFKKVEIDKRQAIAQVETKFTVYQVILNMAPALLTFAAPIFIAGIMSLSIF